jgi:hypothetical protein
MVNVVEGRWLIDFADGPAETGNEVVLGGGVVALAHVGKPIGRYEVKAGELALTLPMPATADEGEWQMILRFALSSDIGAQTNLIGIMHGATPDGDSIENPCTLRRRPSQA